MIKKIYNGPEDNYYDRNSLKILLQRLGAQLITSNNGNPAAYYLDEHNVTIRYSGYGPLEDGIYIAVTAFGTEQDIGKVEKLILESKE